MVFSQPLTRREPVSAGADAALARAVSVGIVESERSRVVVLGALLLAFVGVVLWLMTGPAVVAPDALGNLQRGLPVCLVALAGMLAYEVAIWLWLGRVLVAEREPTALFRYLNATLEMGLTTGLLALAMRPAGVLPLLVGAASWIYFPIVALSALNLSFRLSAYCGWVAAAAFAVLSLGAIRGVEPVAGLATATSPHQYVVKALVLGLSGLASGFVARRLNLQLRGTLRVARERDRAVSIFGQHVSPQVADRLLHQPVDLTGEERDVCVLFLDIRDFSRIAAERTPPAVMEYLNRLFGAMITVVNDHRGIVNKFLGDGFMAVFGAPVGDSQLCRNAVTCGLRLLEVVEDLSRRGVIPPTRVGIGLHVGTAVTGNVGSEERKEYTVIGDTVNLAARIEQATKPLGARMLISEAVWAALGTETVAGEDVGVVELKGQSQPVRLWKLA